WVRSPASRNRSATSASPARRGASRPAESIATWTPPTAGARGKAGAAGAARGRAAGRAGAAVDGADGGDPDHGSVSTYGAAVSSSAVVRLRTSRPGRALATTSAMAACRSGVATVPVTTTSWSSTLTSSSSSAVRGSVARASQAWATRYSAGTPAPVSWALACSSSDSITQSGTRRPLVWAYSSRL